MSLPVWGFVALTVPLVLSPGPSTTVVLRNSISGGTRAGLLTTAGTNSGSVCYGLLTAFGFAVAMERWPSAWLIVRWAGVAYLTWLGLQSLARVLRGRTGPGGAPAPLALDGWRSFTSGFLTNLLNPSLAAFYLIVLPQFVPREVPFVSRVLTLTALHVAMAASWHTAWALAGATLARVLSRRRPRQMLDAITGIALIWLALLIAF